MIPDREIDLIERTTAIFKIAFQKVWTTWPFGQCGVTCLILAPILRTVTTSNVKVHVGYIKISEKEHRHAWIVVAGYYVVDPTYEQFSHPEDFNGGLKKIEDVAPEELDESTLRSCVLLDEAQESAYRNSIIPQIPGDGSNWAVSGLRNFWGRLEGIE